MNAIQTGTASSERVTGLAYGVGAYALWGFMPFYIKALQGAAAPEVLAHRVSWACLLLLGLSFAQGQFPAIRGALRDRRTLLVLLASAVLIAVNWLVYIYAVVSGQVMESSLGYYMNPLFNVLLGVVVLGERLERPVQIAALIAGAGVLWLAVRGGHFPWIAVTLAISFGLYGLMRKLAPVSAVVGLTIETGVLLLPALGYLAYLAAAGEAVFLAGQPRLDVLLVLGGPVTAVPLLFFSGAARRLPLSTLGFLQYLSPTLQLLIAVLVYGERFDAARAVAFGLIWTALAIFAVHSIRRGSPEPVTDTP